MKLILITLISILVTVTADAPPPIISGVSLQGPTNHSLHCVVDNPGVQSWRYLIILYRTDDLSQVANVTVDSPYYMHTFNGLGYCTSYFAKAWNVNPITGEKSTPSVSPPLSTLCHGNQYKTLVSNVSHCEVQTYDVTTATFNPILMSPTATTETLNIDDGDRYIPRNYHVILSETASGKVIYDIWLKDHAVTFDELKPNTEHVASVTLVNSLTGQKSREFKSNKLTTLNGREIKALQLYSLEKGTITYVVDDPGRRVPFNYTITFINKATSNKTVIQTDWYTGVVNGFTSGETYSAKVSFSREPDFKTADTPSDRDVTVA